MKHKTKAIARHWPGGRRRTRQAGHWLFPLRLGQRERPDRRRPARGWVLFAFAQLHGLLPGVIVGFVDVDVAVAVVVALAFESLDDAVGEEAMPDDGAFQRVFA